MNSGPPSIWIHAPFRSAGTHVWNQFRKDPRNTCFYEPFNEILSEYQRDTFDETFSDLREHMRHDTRDLEYFHEYPVDANGKIPGSEERFTRDISNPSDPESLDRIRAYLHSLITAAGDTRAVFKCCRADVRARWLSNTFHSRTISVLRHPHHQFHSFQRFPERYFDACTLMQSAICTGDPRDTPLPRVVSLPSLEHGTTRERIMVYQSIARCLPKPVLYANFYYGWWLHLLETIPCADLLIDVNCGSRIPALNQALKDRSFGIQLHNCHPEEYDTLPLEPRFLQKIETWVEQTLAFHLPGQCRDLVKALQSQQGWFSEDTRIRTRRLADAATRKDPPAPLQEVLEFETRSLGLPTEAVFREILKLHTHQQAQQKSLVKMEEYIKSLKSTLDSEKKRFLECERYAKSLESRKWWQLR